MSRARRRAGRAAVVLAAVALAFLPPAPRAGAAQAGELVLRMREAPAITFRDRDGAERRPADLGGRLTLAHFWATWCGTCRTEFPALEDLQREMRADGLRVAAIALDRIGWPAIDRLTGELGVRETALFHDLNREATAAMGVAGLPTTVLIDAQGREVGRIVGEGAWSDPRLRAQLRALMRP
ncbi:MAG: TlpA family protein disulfide reductase [Rhizobiales bacterium]|nr:TlpA family protein disulfide reductase [Hyphomicrobiales bacterium]